MKPPGKHILTLQAAENTLARFFARSPRARSVTPAHIYEIFGRPLDDNARNRNWLSNKLTGLRHHGLVEPRYLPGGKGRGRLAGVELTPSGREAVDRVIAETRLEAAGFFPPNDAVALPATTGLPVPRPSGEPGPLTIEAAMAYMAQWAKEHPSYEVICRIGLKPPA